MTTVTASPVYGSVTTHTITLASLATDANLLVGRQGTVIDNTSELAIDAHVGGKITTGTSPTTAKQIEVWAFGSWDGSTYSAGAGASDGGFTPTGEKTLMRLLQVIPTDATSNHTYEFGPISIAAAFGGAVPRKWGVFVVHNTAVNLNSTGSNHEIKHTPIKYQSA